MTKIYLSPSSQFENKYSGVNTNEAETCRKIASYAKAALERNGYVVKQGANTTTFEMDDRTAESNTWGADIHIAIHTNAGGGQGTEVFAYSGSMSDKYVKAIYNEVAKTSVGSDRGIRNGDNLYEVVNTNAVCVYIECEFHDTNGAWIVQNVKNLGEAITRGVCKAEGKTFKGESGSTNQSTNTNTNKSPIKKATDPAASKSASIAGTYKVTASNGLNVRNGAGVGKTLMIAIPYDTRVKNYGYYTEVNGVKWFYVDFTYKGVRYNGFCSSEYLARV